VIRPDALLFGESTGRVIATSARPAELLAKAREAGVPAQRIGSTGGARLRIGPPAGAAWIDAALADLHAIWSRALPRRLEAA
jgi:phosphoribosylformylglycinamidine synthase